MFKCISEFDNKSCVILLHAIHKEWFQWKINKSSNKVYNLILIIILKKVIQYNAPAWIKTLKQNYVISYIYLFKRKQNTWANSSCIGLVQFNTVCYSIINNFSTCTLQLLHLHLVNTFDIQYHLWKPSNYKLFV